MASSISAAPRRNSVAGSAPTSTPPRPESFARSVRRRSMRRITATVNSIVEMAASGLQRVNSLTKRKEAVRDAIATTDEKMTKLKQPGSSKELEKKQRQLDAHRNTLLKMEDNLENEVFPGPPQKVHVEVTGATEVTVYFKAPVVTDPTIIRYKVEWCTSPEFVGYIDSWEETNMSKLPVRIGNLEKGSFLSFRVSAANIFGYGECVNAEPNVVHLTSWEDVDGQRIDGPHERMMAISALRDQIDKHRASMVWQQVFPTSDGLPKKRKSGVKDLFNASTKFSKNMESGCYLVTLVYTEGKIACTVDDCLPSIAVDEESFGVTREDFHWLMKLSLCWDQLPVLTEYNTASYSNTNSLNFRSKVISAANSMHNALCITDIGRLYQQPITHENAVFLVTVRFMSKPSQMQNLTLRWMSFDKFLRKKSSYPAVEALNKNLLSVMNFFEGSQISLKKGLYLTYLKLQSAINCARLIVPESLPTVLPFIHMRDNPHVTEEEWLWIKAAAEEEEFVLTEAQQNMHDMLDSAATALLHHLDVDADLVPGHRLFRSEVIVINSDVSLLMIFPKAEDVCAAPTSASNGQGEFVEARRGCSAIAIPVFEMAHLWTYEPDFIALYCRLSIFVEYFAMVSQLEQRRSMFEADVKVFQTQHEAMAQFQKSLDDIYQNARWISRIGSIARDKNATQIAVPLSRLLTPNPVSPTVEDTANDVGYHSDHSTERRPRDRVASRIRPSSHAGSPLSSRQIGTVDIDQLYISRRRAAQAQAQPQAPTQPQPQPEATNGPTSSDQSPTTSTPVASTSGNPGPSRMSAPDLQLETNTVIHVYSAYDCGLSEGSSVRLSVTPTTTCQEVVRKVIEQLTKAASRVRRTDVPLPDAEEFCLVSVLGARERRLKEDFQIFRLRNPWSKGKLYVRRRDSILSALVHGNESLV